MNELHVLHLEDNALDAELVSSRLETEGLPCSIDRVSTKDDFQNALQARNYDLILSDFSMPGFDGLSALGMAKKLRPETPFLFLSGTIGEDRAVESLKRGAADYILKDRLQRLTPAILRAHNDTVERNARIKNEEKIRQQTELLDQAKDAIFVRNLNQEITYWNKSAERIYGWTSEEVLGRRASEILYKPGSEGREGIWRSVLEKGEWTGEIAQVTKSGNEIFVSSHRTLLRDGDGKPAAVLNINTDITEKKALETQVLRSQRMDSIGALAGGIAHDLNNVLAPIFMVTELLRDRLRDEADQRMLETVKASAQRGADLVKQILQFARGTKGNVENINLKALVQELIKFVSKTFPPAIVVQTKIAANLFPVSGDPTQLHQVILNLCVNARDAMPEGGLLSVHVRNADLSNRRFPGLEESVSGSFVEIAVSDGGTGIPPEILGRIFEPFFTTKAEGKGTGLGLSTVATIVRNHQGFLDIETALGKGATFRVFLPRAKDKSHKSAEESSSQPAAGRGECILLVDDERALLEMTKELLEAHNYKVFTASNGIEALACFESHKEKIDVLITDLFMPELGGRELIANISDRFPATITICLSGSVDESILRADRKAPSAFLRKPCSTRDLLAVLDKALADRRKKS